MLREKKKQYEGIIAVQCLGLLVLTAKGLGLILGK